MKRVMGLVASGLGAFLLVFALFIRFYLADNVITKVMRSEQSRIIPWALKFLK